MRLILVGFGFLGKHFIREVYNRSKLLKVVGDGLKIVGVSDTSGYVSDLDGLDLEKLLTIEKASEYPVGFFEGGSSKELIEGCDADLMVEATHTNIVDGEPGLSHIREALTKGMHVITSNKGPLAIAFRELTDLAQKKGCELKYEATVAGALPVFSLVRECLRGAEINRISGILNGTTNFILSKMHFEETSFELALMEAQERGLAEADPTYDLEAIDPAVKLVIIANALMERNVKLEDVERIGITRITSDAVRLSKRSGFAVKLIGVIDEVLEVAPKLVPLDHPLCVHGTLNAIHLETDLAGEITTVGKGAGRETVSSMINDLISILVHTRREN